jgi:hypothetical protein
MVKAETGDLKFHLYVIAYMELYVAQERSVGQTIGQAEIDDQTARLHAWRAAGVKYLSQVEPGIKEAAKTMLCQAQQRAVDSDGYVEQLLFNGEEPELVIVPAWYTCYQEAKAIVTAYRTATGQLPL